MRPPPEVAKLIVDSCSRGNPRMITSGGILWNHRDTVLATFRSFLGCQPVMLMKG